LKILQQQWEILAKFSSKSAKMPILLTAILCLLLRNCTKRIKQEFLDPDSVQLKTFAYYLWQI